jgi:hypothetical protein
MCKVRHGDITAAGLCCKGGRQWFVANGLDWAAFVREGIDAETIIKTGCPLGLRVVEAANRREQQNG